MLVGIFSLKFAERVSPHKTQFNQDRLIFFDDVVHAIAFSLCENFAVGGRVKVLTVFLVQDFQKATLWWCCNQRREHCDTDAPHDAEEVVGRMLPSKCRWRFSLARHSARTALLSTFPTGRGCDRYRGVDWTLVVTGPLPGSISRVLVSPIIPTDYGHLP